MNNNELQHYGVLGMKWGQRKKSIAASKPKGQQPAYAFRKTERMKRREDDNSINPHRHNGTSTKSPLATVREAVNTKAKQKTKDKVRKSVQKGIRVVNTLVSAGLIDEFVFGGAGRKLAESALKNAGRAVVTAYTMATGGYDIRWYDN